MLKRATDLCLTADMTERDEEKVKILKYLHHFIKDLFSQMKMYK